MRHARHGARAQGAERTRQVRRVGLPRMPGVRRGVRALTDPDDYARGLRLGFVLGVLASGAVAFWIHFSTWAMR